MAKDIQLDGFRLERFAAEGYDYPVYWGGEGPGVVVIHEVPGVTPSVADFARRVIAEGFTVAMPSLFGTPDKPMSGPYSMQQLALSCVRRAFHVLASRRSSPVCDYLRALCRETHARCGGPGVGAIGMCLTGNFALSLMVDESVMAPVLSQPSLPFGLTRGKRRGLHLSDADLAVVKRRAAEGCGVLAMRFTRDPMVPAARFERLRQELGDGVETIEIDNRKGNPWGIPMTAHSVMTNHLVDEEGHPTRAALDRVLALFHERLRSPSA